MLQLHAELDLLDQGPVCEGVRVPERRTTVHGCYFWGRCKNNGRLMPFPNTARGLLGNFLHGADPHVIN